MKQVPPSVSKTAFNCPHCDVLTTQEWYLLYVGSLPSGRSPLEEKLLGWTLNIQACQDRKVSRKLGDVFASQCFDCRRISVWIDRKIVHPQRGTAPAANADLSEDIRRDYDEASSILSLSPRGAAALLRWLFRSSARNLVSLERILMTTSRPWSKAA